MDKTTKKVKTVPDEFLIQIALEGDESAYKQLFNRYEDKVYSICLKNSNGDKAKANDLCQETFISAFRSLEGLRDKSSFSYWLNEIARNKCISYARKQASIERTLREYEVFKQTLIDDKDTWTESVFHVIEDLINNLDNPETKETIQLFYIEGKGTSEIAKIQNISVSAVTSRLNRFRTKFRRQIIIEVLEQRES